MAALNAADPGCVLAARPLFGFVDARQSRQHFRGEFEPSIQRGLRPIGLAN